MPEFHSEYKAVLSSTLWSLGMEESSLWVT